MGLFLGGAALLSAQNSAQFAGQVNPFVRAAVELAVKDATSLLAGDHCEEIFTDFHDPGGSPLATQLAQRQLSAHDHLRSIRFADGGQEAPCSDAGVFAFTRGRGDTIFVCGSRFATLTRRNRPVAAALILHEELHLLGLAENPPLSREITTQVLARCGLGK